MTQEKALEILRSLKLEVSTSVGHKHKAQLHEKSSQEHILTVYCSPRHCAANIAKAIEVLSQSEPPCENHQDIPR